MSQVTIILPLKWGPHNRGVSFLLPHSWQLYWNLKCLRLEQQTMPSKDEPQSNRTVCFSCWKSMGFKGWILKPEKVFPLANILISPLSVCQDPSKRQLLPSSFENLVLCKARQVIWWAGGEDLMDRWFKLHRTDCFNFALLILDLSKEMKV